MSGRFSKRYFVPAAVLRGSTLALSTTDAPQADRRHARRGTEGMYPNRSPHSPAATDLRYFPARSSTSVLTFRPRGAAGAKARNLPAGYRRVAIVAGKDIASLRSVLRGHDEIDGRLQSDPHIRRPSCDRPCPGRMSPGRGRTSSRCRGDRRLASVVG